MTARISWEQALAWRMRRQMLDPIGALPADEVVRRLCAVQAQVPSSAELAIRLRSDRVAMGAVAEALASGRLIRTWAMRGTLHLLTPQEAGCFLALIAAGRSWELPSWQRAFGMPVERWDELRDVVREALDGTILTRDELIAAITRRPALSHLAEALRSGWGTLLKPLAFQGELCFGPSRAGRTTFTRPAAASAEWTGLAEPDEAGPRAIASYLAAYGPATLDNFRKWLARGRVRAGALREWFAAARDRLVPVDVEGETAYLLAEDLDELSRISPSDVVRLLPGFDAYVLGPGTDDGHVLGPARRAAVSRQSGWISPVIVAGGAVAGTWELDGERLRASWFREAGAVPHRALEGEIARLSAALGRDLRLAVSVA